MPAHSKSRPRSRSALPPAYIVVYSPDTMRALGRELNAIARESRKRAIAEADARTRRLQQLARERRKAAAQQSQSELPTST